MSLGGGSLGARTGVVVRVTAVTSDRTLRGIRQAAELIGQADALLVTAGAGMGVDSGLPDFRGKQGFWRGHDRQVSGAALAEEFIQGAEVSAHPGRGLQRLELRDEIVPGVCTAGDEVRNVMKRLG